MSSITLVKGGRVAYVKFDYHPGIVDVDEHHPASSTFSIEPLHGGYGNTLGNSLRRVLLSSIAGEPLHRSRFEGITHEFTTVPGVKEDVVDVMQNLKGIHFRVYGDEPQQDELSSKVKV